MNWLRLVLYQPSPQKLCAHEIDLPPLFRVNVSQTCCRAVFNETDDDPASEIPKSMLFYWPLMTVGHSASANLVQTQAPRHMRGEEISVCAQTASCL